MKTKTILFALASLILLVSCTNKAKQPKEESLWDENPQATQVAQSDGKIRLNTTISPPPPGRADTRDTTSVIASDKISPSDTIYNVMEVDFLPAYPNGGWESFSGYIQSVRYPKELKEKEIKGSLSASFVVEKDGSVSHIEVKNSVDKIIDNEIINALQNMPAWKPGKKDGLYVRSKYGFTLVYGV